MQDAKEEVRARLSIEDVIGEYVQLKRAGRNFKGLSPFSAEKTPSFVVSPDKQIWHDFSSGKGGDIFSFVMQVEGMDFRQALEHLARRAGVDLTMYQSARSGEIAKKKKRLLEANELAARYFQQSLVGNAHALQYVFEKRTLNKQVVTDFRLGYAPSAGDALVSLLKKKGFSAEECKEAGLTNRFGGDLFRGRMMVPLMDGGGQVIGFTARIIEDDPKAPKYLNTPQTLLYDKSRHVFGLSQAKDAIRAADYSVVVEGNLDVVSSHQAGIRQVVATAGTAMTEHHLKALSRLSGIVKLAFDGDKAGLAATERAIPIAQAVGVELEIVTLPEDAKDPDELIKKDPALWKRALEHAKPAVDWLLDQYQGREDMSTASGKRAYTTAGLSLVRHLSDPVDQDHYLQLMSRVSGASLDALRSKLAGVSRSESPALKPVTRQSVSADTKAINPHQEDALAVLLLEPSARSELTPQAVALFEEGERRAVAEYLATTVDSIDDIPEELKKYDTYVKILLLRAENRYASWDTRERSLEAARLLRQMVTEHNKTKRDTLIAKLRDAEDAHDDEAAALLRAELNTLIKEIKHG